MRLKRLLTGLGLSLLVLAVVWQPAKAWAVDDSVDSWQIAYSVDKSGTLHVQETLVYRFGSNSGRHGIDRVLVTREPWGSTDQDAVYTISNINVTSPDASAAFTTSTIGSGRDQQLDIRVGSASRVIYAETATYTLTYDVGGAMRSDQGYDELYWDAIGDNTPIVSNISITATVPGGVQQAVCFVGTPGSSGSCSSASVGADGTATYTVGTKSAKDLVTIGAMIAPGLVANNQPDLRQRADQASMTSLRLAGGVAGGTAAATALGVGVLGVRNRRDQRFLGIAPGSVDPSGQGVGPDNHPTIPVSFAPPSIPVASAGFIDDGVVDVRDMTGALMSLAVRGAIQLRQDPARARSWVFGGVSDQTIHAKLVRTDIDMAPHEMALLRDIFPGLVAGSEQSLTGQGKLYTAFQHMQSNVTEEATRAGWYVRPPVTGMTPASAGPGASFGHLVGTLFIAMWAIVLFGGMGLAGLAQSAASANFGWLIWVLPLVILLIGFIVYKGMTRRGQRSAVGRAYADQVTGFREYLTTAEADQIKFEEGQDIFSQYLPWAVIYGVAERWSQVCSKLVDEGRLAAIRPSWYYGDYRYFNMYWFTNSLGNISQASMPAQPVSSGWSSGGTGFGGGSGFGGGGFAGGGGGGGGVSSW